jgi:hypothetical protein
VPVDDARLEQALHGAAPVVEHDGVLDRVASKRTRRRRNRRLATATSAAVAVALVVVTAVFVTRDNGSAPHVAAPGAALSARVVTGDDATGDGRTVTPRPVTLDADPGVLVGPMSVGSTSLSVASHDRGTDGAPLTHVVRIDGTHVIDVKDFKAEILSITEGEGARWALTRNPRAISRSTIPDAFLKRIGAVGDPVSITLPPGSDPVGPIAAVGGAVWVPLRDGVLQYDPADAHFVRRIALAPADTREVAQVGKLAYVSDGGTLRQLDSFTGLGSDSIRFGPEILGLASAGFDGRVLLRNEQAGTEHARVAHADSDDPVRLTAVLPAGFLPDHLEASPTRFWVTGSVDGAPAIALLNSGDGVRATVVVDTTGDTSLAWTDAHTVTAVTDGRMYTITLP